MNKSTKEILFELGKQTRGPRPTDPILGKVQPGPFFWIAHPPFPCVGADTTVTTRVTAQAMEEQIDALYELGGQWEDIVWPHLLHLLGTIPEKPLDDGGRIIELQVRLAKERKEAGPNWSVDVDVVSPGGRQNSYHIEFEGWNFSEATSMWPSSPDPQMVRSSK